MIFAVCQLAWGQTAYDDLNAQLASAAAAASDPASTRAAQDAAFALRAATQKQLDALDRAVFTGNTVALQVAAYRHNGPAVLNDLTATPGDVRTMDTAQLCSASFHTGTVRNVPESVKHSVCRAYGLTPAQCTGQQVEIDHLISLELGGSNDPKNLWPEPYFPKPGAKEKDLVENWLHREVCSGKVSLAEAQKEISTDWFQVYQDAGLKTAQKPAGASGGVLRVPE
jgi:hypothetical protein